MFKSTRYLYSAARQPSDSRPFCLTVSLTHPHDPYTIHREYWDRYEGEDIPLPSVTIPEEEQDPHSQRLLNVCGLKDANLPDEAIVRARRAYFGAMSYVDDNVGKLLRVLEECGMDDDTIVIFSSDHGDMLGERGLWYVDELLISSLSVIRFMSPSSSSTIVKLTVIQVQNVLVRSLCSCSPPNLLPKTFRTTDHHSQRVRFGYPAHTRGSSQWVSGQAPPHRWRFSCPVPAGLLCTGRQ